VPPRIAQQQRHRYLDQNPKRSRHLSGISPRVRPLIGPFIFALALGATAPLSAEELPFAGPYLAAQQASLAGDYSAAALYTAQALAADPQNRFLQEAALIAFLGSGDTAAASELARRMGTSPPGSPIAALMVISDAALSGSYGQLLELLQQGTSNGPLVEALVKAWAQLGAGQMSQAIRSFEELSQDQAFRAFAQYHWALALAAAGDFEASAAIFEGESGAALRATRRGVLAYVQVLSQLERADGALAEFDNAFGNELDQGLEVIRARLAAGETLPFTMITSAVDGLAEVFFSVAGALASETPDAYAMSYARAAQYLRPDHADAVLLVANILEILQQYELAIAAYSDISSSDPAYNAAELGRAEALMRLGRVEEAVAVLAAMTKANPDQASLWVRLGDMLRRNERYGEAANAYDAAIALYGPPAVGHWFVYFARGICFEREKQWPKAEADFRTALSLVPEQPQVLNYLGYSFVDMNENLVEALDMIERAADAMPDDGAIADSLGWALYRLGRYEEAVGPMEHAVARMPVDPLINDHLGDVYWAVGREREAVFQWRRALSFKPETEAEADRIRRKLEIGLDAVLEEEGAPPLKAVRGDR
jgi:tetratricopeptide (TPR) repeat protein